MVNNALPQQGLFLVHFQWVSLAADSNDTLGWIWLPWYIPYSTRLINAPKRAGISSSLWILFKSFSSIQFFLYSLSPWNMRFTLNCLDLGDHLSSTYIYMLRENKGHQICSYSFWCKYAGDPSSIWEHCHVDWCRPALLLAKCGRKKTDERGRSTGCRDKLTTVSSVQPYLFLVSFFYSPFYSESLWARVYRSGCDEEKVIQLFASTLVASSISLNQDKPIGRKEDIQVATNLYVSSFFFIVTCDWLHFRYVSRTFFPLCRRHTENHAQLQFFCFLIAFYFLFPLECLTVPL